MSYGYHSSSGKQTQQGTSPYYYGSMLHSNNSPSSPMSSNMFLDHSGSLNESFGGDDDDNLLIGTDLRSSADSEQRGSNLMNKDDGGSNIEWNELFTADEKERKNNMKHIIKQLQQAITENRPSCKQLLPRIVKLANECPFTDIKKTFQDFINSMKDEFATKKIMLPEVPLPSQFFKDIIPVDTQSEPVASIFKEIFLMYGRVTHTDRVMAWHPTYFESFLRTYNMVMRADGPLPLYMRNYIAILAASRFKCQYIVQQQEQEFLLNGGDSSWLDGIEYIPPKLHKLLEANSILAHQPWLLTSKTIEKLVKGDDPFTRWSTAELVHALILMATFRMLSGFVMAIGINPEVDFVKSSEKVCYSLPLPHSSNNSDTEYEDVTKNTEEIIDRLKKAIKSMEEEQSMEQKRKLFEQAGAEPEGNPCCPPVVNSDVSQFWGEFYKYIGPFTIQHSDFDVKSKDYEVFHVQDYSWQEQGYELLQRYYSVAAGLLDEEWNTIFNMTANTFNGQQGVDTAPFRQSVWYYVHRIQGVLHDDYDYTHVNALLNVRMKTFIKKMTCRPDTINVNDISNLGYHLQPEEKCHLALLAVEARKQAELLYGLHALMKLMSS